ncbi:Nuclear speckle splicing regulatory protein [Schistosoma japonicum]|uniref:Nuclear speckle splicing regulatory protein n=1 Tax=Schistosoma japonicum TaxID=6182 RepID=A0A4Z2D138_SCHJA|nr:Nuclear speckle splicing regulatory protein [Schistosoma japonicum]
MSQGRGKVYGLSFPTRKPNIEPKLSVNAVFNEDSDKEEGEKELKPADYSRTTWIAQSRINRKVKTELEKAFEEDPSIFQYDELLDVIHDTKVEDSLGKTVKTSRYVGKLMKASSERKLERELCVERKAQRRIEAEVDLYGDKESFVTSAYKNKLEELRTLVEKLEEEKQREEVMDIRKQDGLGGLYRFMYENQDKTEIRRLESNPPINEKWGQSEENTNFEQPVKQSFTERSEKRDEAIQQCDNSKANNKIPLHSRDEKFFDCDGVSTEVSYKSDKLRTDRQVKADLDTCSNKEHKKVSGVIMARLRVTSDEELAAARQRYLARKAAGIHPVIVESD